MFKLFRFNLAKVFDFIIGGLKSKSASENDSNELFEIFDEFISIYYLF